MKFNPSAEPVAPSPEKPSHTREAVRRLQEISTRSENFIDEGGAGRVYELPAGVCMKVLKEKHESANSHLMRLGNTLEQESAFLDKLMGFSYKKARTPNYLGYVRTEKNGGPAFLAILMEQLRAVNLQKVLNGEEEMPASFNYHGFFDALEGYIDKLNTEMHIAHGDLEARNVMVDIETGEPRVIDFGNAVWLKEDTPAQKQAKAGFIRTDWAKLEKLAEQVEAYQAKKGS